MIDVAYIEGLIQSISARPEMWARTVGELESMLYLLTTMLVDLKGQAFGAWRDLQLTMSVRYRTEILGETDVPRPIGCLSNSPHLQNHKAYIRAWQTVNEWTWQELTK